MIPTYEEWLKEMKAEMDKEMQDYNPCKGKSTEELQQIVANCLANTSNQDKQKRLRKMRDTSLAFNIIQYFNQKNH